jgi:hypothetical protein
MQFFPPSLHYNQFIFAIHHLPELLPFQINNHRLANLISLLFTSAVYTYSEMLLEYRESTIHLHGYPLSISLSLPHCTFKRKHDEIVCDCGGEKKAKNH